MLRLSGITPIWGLILCLSEVTATVKICARLRCGWSEKIDLLFLVHSYKMSVKIAYLITEDCLKNMRKPIISASILSANFAHLAQDANAILTAGADALHIDIMDHHFVPNLSFGTLPCTALRTAGISAEMDVHLMVDAPQDYIAPFAKAGATRLTFHPETTKTPDAIIKEIKQHGMEAGLAFNPDKPIVLSDALISSLDLILVMSVFPGFGGQRFIPESLKKIRSLRKQLDRLQANTLLAVDGGVKENNIHAIYAAGADYFVMGSELFLATCYKTKMNSIAQTLKQ